MTCLADMLEGAWAQDPLGNVKVERASLTLREKRLVCDIISDEMLSAAQLEKIKNGFCEELGIQNVTLRVRYTDLQWDGKTWELYVPHLVQRLTEEQAAIAECLLRDAAWVEKDGILTVHVRYGAVEQLCHRGIGLALEEMILQETGRHVKVTICDSKQKSDFAQEDRERMQKLEEEMQKALPETPAVPVQNYEAKSHIEQEEIEVTGVLKGKRINEEDVTMIAHVSGDMNNCKVRGDIIGIETRELKSGKTLVCVDITDYSSSIRLKLFEGVKTEETDEGKRERAQAKMDKLMAGLKEGNRILAEGKVTFDTYEKQLIIMPRNISTLQKQEKQDNAEKKRVELHLHTQMSTMDGMANVKDLVKRAIQWGHPAIAITDHGVAQAFPDAFSTARGKGIKVIYGVECYLEGDRLTIVYNDTEHTLDDTFVVFDIETTGFGQTTEAMTEIGAVKIQGGKIIDRFSTFVNPERHIPENITELTSITDEMVADAPKITEALPQFMAFCDGCVVAAHNANFDVGFMKVAAARQGRNFDYPYIDTLDLCRALFTDIKKHSLAKMVDYLHIELNHHHRAVDDAEATAEIFKVCLEKLRAKGIEKLEDINTALLDDNPKKARYYHAILLAKNETGLRNMYHIISQSHMKYYYRRPIVPKKLLAEYREGLLTGSACEAGELYRAILNGRGKKEIARIVNEYDYLEIQPLGNNDFLLREGRVGSEEELRDINRRIVDLGKRYNKPVVATCDVHFMDPQDEAFRRILMDGKGFNDADNQAPLYFRTTDEMLEEFSYLGEETAYQVVVENTNKIADMIDDIQLLPDESHPPHLDGAEEELIEISKKKAYELYGDPLPEIVQKRMDKELHSITTYGYSVLYVIAQKLVWKSLADGYLVGSRGSVGSSFIAFLMGITEVNALQPHYVCPKCKYSEFITDGSVGSGSDMEDKNCPECGALMHQDGQDIPFETFLGFKGDKEPDIDLNFSGDYQPVAHKYTEELFGEGHVFRAGTIGTVAEKTAYGYVKKYFEKRGLNPPEIEINRLTKGCTGVKRTTGQHPGGVMVVPREEDIHWYCPIQHPADDASCGIVTTHFDYHSISGRLLKLDILGHDDPTVIRMLEDLTGLDAKTIPIGEKKVMSLFTSTEALGVTPEDINSPVGSYGIPEFGTPFVRKMLVDTKPTTFAELMRISGLSHGTDVWLNNAQTLVQEGTATLKEVICTRDDIMTYLIYAGLPSKESFTIMEQVRKGKGLKPEDEALMREHDVPEWYIDSCKKIKYMFPKAHAAAYVMMAFRIAYFKVYHPKAFYSTYFTIRGDGFDANIMTGRIAMKYDKEQKLMVEEEYFDTSDPKTVIRHNMLEYLKMEKPGVKEKDIATTLELCNEMYARGITFLPIDIYESDAVRFLPKEEGLLPPLMSLPGLGENAAKTIAEERSKGEFFTIEELAERTKVSKTIVALMKDYGVLDEIPETQQVTMF